MPWNGLPIVPIYIDLQDFQMDLRGFTWIYLCILHRLDAKIYMELRGFPWIYRIYINRFQDLSKWLPLGFDYDVYISYLGFSYQIPYLAGFSKKYTVTAISKRDIIYAIKKDINQQSKPSFLFDQHWPTLYLIWSKPCNFKIIHLNGNQQKHF